MHNNLSDFVVTSRYSRYIKEEQRRETWREAAKRGSDMHIKKYPHLEDMIEKVWDEFVVPKKVLGSQRALQYAGPAMFQHNARGYNCSASYVDRPRFFQEMLYLLLCGVGVGFSVQFHHVAKLPRLVGAINPRYRINYTIPDTIEGWSDAIGVLINSYFVGNEYSNHNVVFDYSQIRPKGSPFSHGCGTAPGSAPIERSIEHIREHLNQIITTKQHKLRPIQVYDINMYLAEAVLSGGVRRSATICLFSPSDKEMMLAKTGNWYETHRQRGMSNNSAVLIRDNTTKEEFNKLVECAKEFGEPGFIWADSTEALTNPCAEIGLYAYDKDGNSGWQLCNLTEINGAAIEDETDFIHSAEAASFIGTMQAGYDEFPYLGPVTESIVRREALLGVSITGIMDTPDVLLNPDTQRRAALAVRKKNKQIAELIGINQSARTTCVKPAGSTSLIMGTATGIHPHYAKRYIRRIQSNKMDPVYSYFKSINENATEDSMWSKSGSDGIAMFPVLTKPGAITWDDVTDIDLLEAVKLTQNNWVAHGKNHELCVQPWLNHSVSNTVMVSHWNDVSDFIFENRDSFTGVSLLGKSNEINYVQPPNTGVKSMTQLVDEYGKDVVDRVTSMIEIGIKSFGNVWSVHKFLNNGYKDNEDSEIRDWAEQVAVVSKKTTDRGRCFYDVYNHMLFNNLLLDTSQVDYRNLTETRDNTKSQLDWACAGGACEI